MQGMSQNVYYPTGQPYDHVATNTNLKWLYKQLIGYFKSKWKLNVYKTATAAIEPSRDTT